MSITIKPALKAGVPLVIIETADATQTRNAILAELNGLTLTSPILFHDLSAGLSAYVPNPNEKYRKPSAGERLMTELFEGMDAAAMKTLNPAEMFASINNSTVLSKLGKAETPLFIFSHNPQLFWKNEYIIQGIWNLRDVFETIGSQLYMLVPPGTVIPAELKLDCITLAEEIPTVEEVGQIVDSIAEDAGVTKKIANKDRIVDTLLGYPSKFATKQAFAMSITKSGVDMDLLWKTRVATMKSMAGLEISLPKDGYSNLAGCFGIKDFLSMYISGRRPPRIVFWLDEIEKMVGGASTDSSGVSQAMMENFLFWTEDQKVDAVLLTGIPGAGKSATAKCTAGEAGVPLAHGSMSTAKGSLVGQSEAQWKQLLGAVASIGRGQVLMIGTCNNIEILPPEVLSRFKLGTFFYDYPTGEELAAIWNLYIKKYELDDTAPEVDRWVGREVESCCHRAWLFNKKLADVAGTVVPVSMASSTKMDVLRRGANGRFNSAAQPGVYQIETIDRPVAAKGRRMNLGA